MTPRTIVLDANVLMRAEVWPPLRQLDDSDWMVEITIRTSGEKAEFRRSHLLDDPEAL